MGAIIEGIKLSVAVPCAGESPNLYDTNAGSLDVRKTHSKQNLAAQAGFILNNKNETIYDTIDFSSDSTLASYKKAIQLQYLSTPHFEAIPP